jgi:acetylornithine deacetylase
MSNTDIQKTELWEVARQLISFNTVSANSNLEAAEYLANYLEAAGLTVRVVTDDVNGVKKASVLAWAGPQIPGGLILSGHTDVVPFDGQPGWKTDPLIMQTDGKRIYGRGVSDMKVFLAQVVVAAKKYAGTALKRPLMLIFTYDEEVAGQGSGRLVKSLPNFFKDYPKPEFALIGEPTDFEIIPAHKGYAAFDIRVHGKGGHSSLPHKGLNAIEKTAEIIKLIQEADIALKQHASEENRQLFPDFPYSSFNYGMINGGLAPNMIADACRLTMSMRIAPGDKLDEIIGELKERIEREVTQEMRAFAPESGVFIENMIFTPPMKSPLESPLGQLLSKVLGTSVGPGAPYATDGGQFEVVDIHSYICGPGSLSEAHQPNESLDPAAFLTGQDYIEHIIQEWCVEGNYSY